MHVVGSALGVLDVDVDVAIIVEDAGVEQLVLQLEPASSAVRGDEIGVRELVQRISVAVLQVRARRSGVEVEVVLLHVLTVIALGVRQSEHPLLQDRIDPVPERNREAQALVVVAEAGDSVLAPFVRARASLVVAEVVPRVAVVAVVLPHRSPLPLAEVRTPPLPGDTGSRLLQAVRFDSVRHPNPHRSCPGRFNQVRRSLRPATTVIDVRSLDVQAGDMHLGDIARSCSRGWASKSICWRCLAGAVDCG